MNDRHGETWTDMFPASSEIPPYLFILATEKYYENVVNTMYFVNLLHSDDVQLGFKSHCPFKQHQFKCRT
jgi:hypothetical protein